MSLLQFTRQYFLAIINSTVCVKHRFFSRCKHLDFFYINFLQFNVPATNLKPAAT